MELVLAALFGFAGGMLGGLVGVGGGVLFVPALVIFLDEPQVRAEATSLLAITITSVVGTWRQHGYGNVRLRPAALIGVLSLAGVAAGVIAANALPERALQVGFALLALAVAAQLLRRAIREP